MKKILLGLIILLCTASALDTIAYATVYINENGQSYIEEYGVSKGIAPDPLQEGNYSYIFYDKNGKKIVEKTFKMHEFIEHNNTPDDTIILVRTLYKQNLGKLEVYNGSNLLVEQELNFCNNNSRCTGKENVLSCPQDCPSGLRDEYCDMIIDTRIDPDCERGIDPDEQCNYNKKCESELGENAETCKLDCSPIYFESIVQGNLPKKETGNQTNKTIYKGEQNNTTYLIVIVVGIVIAIIGIIVFKSMKKR